MQLYKAGGFLCEDFTCFGIALKHVDYFQGICFVIGIEFQNIKNVLSSVGCVTNEKNGQFLSMLNKDGSRPTAYAVQTAFANQLKVLCSKGIVLNIQAKVSAKTESGECKEAERKLTD